MENQSTVKYIELINKRFNQIGKPYSKPRVMSFMADGETQELEEPANTFSSMNFALKMIMELPGKYYVLMTKPQAIRFVRVIKQRILKTLNNTIDFININLTKKESDIFNIKMNARFIEKLTNRLRDVEKKHSITDADLYKDTPAIIQKYLNQNHPLTEYSPEYKASNSPEYRASNSPEYKASNSPEYKVVSHSDIVEKDIMDFQIKLEEIDEEDKEKHAAKQEVDTPAIVESIDNLKVEFLDLFIPKIRALFEQYYAADLKEIKDTLIRNYTERLVGIRNSSHFKGSTGFQPNTTRVAERRKKEQARIAKQQLKPKQNKMVGLPAPAFAPTEPMFAPAPAFAPTEPIFAPAPEPMFAPAFAPTAPAINEKPRVPIVKPRTRKKIIGPTAFNQTANAPTAPAINEKPRVPIQRSRKKTVAPPAPLLDEKPRVPIQTQRTRKKIVGPTAFNKTANAPPAPKKMPTPRGHKVPAKPLPVQITLKKIVEPPEFAPNLVPKKLKTRSNNPKPRVRKPRNTSYSNALAAVAKRASNTRQIKFNQPNTSL